MKKSIIFITGILLIVVCFAAVFAGCKTPEAPENVVEGLPSDILSDVDVAPEQAVADTATVDILQFINDENLTNGQKIAKIMDAIEENETKVLRYTYFKYTKGTTKLSEANNFMMIYQRLKKQDREVKDDIILKYPINLGTSSMMFNLYSATAAKSKGIYADGKLWRLAVDNADLKYDEKTGLISVDDSAWKKGSDFGDKDETSLQTQNREESKKTALNFSCEGIISNDGAKIEKKTTESGAVYYELTFKADIDVANADSATIDKLEQDNTASKMSFNELSVSVQVWECGLIKEMYYKESWNGTIIGQTGVANSETYIEYSYSERDNSNEKTQSIINGLK